MQNVKLRHLKAKIKYFLLHIPKELICTNKCKESGAKIKFKSA